MGEQVFLTTFILAVIIGIAKAVLWTCAAIVAACFVYMFLKE